MVKVKSTIKQKRLAKAMSDNVSNGKSLGQMMRDSGYSDSMSKAPSRILEGKGMVAILDSVGLTDEFIAKRLIDGCDSTKPIACNVYVKDKITGKDIGEMVEAGEASKDFIDVEDMPTRHKYLSTALEIRGHVKKLGNGTNIQVININHGYRDNNKSRSVRSGSKR